MALEIIPAIDLRGGRCVRLLQGASHRETVYSQVPLAVAQEFVDGGAQRLHIVDLDGAFTGEQQNLAIIKAIAQRVAVPLEVGGGLRTLEALERVFQAGVTYAILGTAALENPDLVAAATRRYPGRIIAGIDARRGFVAVRGWVEDSQLDALELARRMGDAGVREIIFTDIARDGMLTGPNLDALQRIVTAGVDVIASGGIGSLKDIEAVAQLREPKIVGLITGQALYTGRFTVEEAIAASRGWEQ